MHVTPLPHRLGEQFRDRTFETGVVIGHDKLNAVEASGLEAFDEGRNDP